ncbi:uncharacterized protein TNCV_1798131 [Trichonephila clavipes]|nr:uncharacterized protein TNCV_1798131 [Trichonephila clavipes]
MRERSSCTSSRSMLTLPEKALLVKLYYQNGNVLVQRYVPIAIRRDDRPRSGRPSTRRNAAETVKDEMETVAESHHPSLADKHLLERTIFMQDGAPPHIARRVKDLLRRSFGDDRVLSRHFHHAWPPRSQISVRAIIGFGVT